MRSLVTFQNALQDLTVRLSQGHARRDSLQPQIDAVIASLPNIAGLVASAKTLAALSKEVRGLTASCQRIIATGGRRPEALTPVQASPEPVPVLIERRLKEINSRLDALHKAPEPLAPKATEVEHDTPIGGAQDALETVHATLSQLIGQLETNLKASRVPRSTSFDAEPAPDPLGSERVASFASQHDLDSVETGQLRQPQYASPTFYTEPERRSRSIVIPVRQFIFGALVIVLAAAAARMSIPFADFSLPDDIESGRIPACGRQRYHCQDGPRRAERAGPCPIAGSGNVYARPGA